MRELALNLIGFSRPRVALPRRVEHGPHLAFGFLPGREAVIGVRNRPAERTFEFRPVREPRSHLFGRAVENFQKRDLVLNRIVRRLGLRQQVLREEVVDRLRLRGLGAGPGFGGDRLVTLGVSYGVLLGFRIPPRWALIFASRSPSARSRSATRARFASHMPHDVPTIPASSASTTRLAAITCLLFRLTNFLKR